jgi:hypothetical protein
MNVKTDQLIDRLSANLEPVNARRLGKTLVLAILAGGTGAAVLMLATVGPRASLLSAAHLEWTAAKLVLPLSVIGLGIPSLARSMRPGLETATNWRLVFFPFAVAIATGLAMLLIVHPEAWMRMLLGSAEISSPRCFLCILSFAATPLAVLIWALREGAPTRLETSGTLAGLVAGGLGAAVYAFNCDSDTIPFITIWYSAAILLCALIGTKLGSRLLRW